MSSAAHTPPGYTPPVPYRSWFARNWKWFAPSVVGFLALSFGLLIWGALRFTSRMFRQLVPYQTAVQKAEQSALVAERLGRPIQIGDNAGGDVSISNESGHARLSIPISGPRGTGHIIVNAKKIAGQWTYQTLEVHIDGDETVIPLLGPGGGEAAPADDSVWEISSARRVDG
jgi:hypothetical protein